MDARELIPGFEPETDLERQVVTEPELLEGLAWGQPRAGHPEGAVGTHVGHAKETVASKAGDAKETVASKAGDSSIPSVGGESARATPAASNGGSNDREREGARQKREQNRQARRKATT